MAYIGAGINQTKTSVENSKDEFFGTYYGRAASDPTADPLGNQIDDGDLYYNTTEDALKIRAGGQWLNLRTSGNGYQQFTATADQTTFNVSGTYTPGFVIVTLNGVVLASGDYDDSSGTEIVLTDGAAADDILGVYIFDTFSVSDTVSASAGGTFSGAVTFNDKVTLSTVTSATRPPNPDSGSIHFNSDLNLIEAYDGSDWLPVGERERIARLEDNLALNTVRDVVDTGFSVLDMIQGVSDAFVDESGIDNGNSSNIVYNSDEDYYSGLSLDQILLNPTGSDGSNTFVTDLGRTLTNINNSWEIDTSIKKFGTASALNTVSRDELAWGSEFSDIWDFGTGPFTIEFYIYLPSLTNRRGILGHSTNNFEYFSICFDATFQSGDSGFGPAGGLEFRQEGSGFTSFTLAQQDLTGWSTNTWHHCVIERNDSGLMRLYLDGTIVASDTFAGDIYYDEAEILRLGEAAVGNDGFGLENGTRIDSLRILKRAVYDGNYVAPTDSLTADVNNIVLESESFSADIVPTNGRGVLIAEPLESLTLNTDLIVEISRDGGTTWSAGTLEEEADYDQTSKVYSTGDIDLSSQPSGSSVAIRVRTQNEANVNIHAWVVQWR